MINPFSQDEYDNEINRMIKMGWNLPTNLPFPTLSRGTNRDGDFVSFPQAAYETDFDNKDLETFWGEIRSKAIFKMLADFEINTLWEIGSGDGSAAIPLTSMGIKVVCVEPIKAGADFTSDFGIQTYCSKLENLDLPRGSVSAIGIFDVLEHIEDTRDFLTVINRALSESGKLVLSVPMYMNLFSDFDEAIGHYRRYSKDLLTRQLSISGFEILKMKYMFSYLILPAFLLRRVPYLLGRRLSYAKIHIGMNNQLSLGKYLKPIIFLLAKFEEKYKIPFGLTLIVVAEKS